MIERYHEIQRRKAAGEVDVAGFTLIELLIVIVVLGILAAVVVFALGSVTGSSVVSACNADAKTVQVAVAAFEANNANGASQLTAAAGSGLLTGSTLGGPYLQTWPDNTQANYTIAFDGGTPGQVDVLVAGVQKPAGGGYDATSCATASTK